jgi:selenocysteine lyase/cysteine desulfurase
MRLLPLPAVAATRGAAAELTNRLALEYAVECPVEVWNDRVLLRVSAQLYNSIADYERLACALKGLMGR